MFTFRRVAYLLFVTCAAYAAHYFIDSPETAWIIPVTYTLSLVTSGKTLLIREFVIFVAGLLLVLTSLLSSNLMGHHELLIVYLLLVMLLYMRFLHHRISDTKLFVLFTFLTMIFASKIGSQETNTLRAAIILLGVFIAMLSQLLFWKILLRDNIDRALKSVVSECRHVNRAIFTCFLSSDYADYPDIYESDLHVHKRKLYKGLSDLRLHEYINSRRQVEIFESIFENMMDYAQLRSRIEDHSSYSLFSIELRAIEAAIDGMLASLLMSDVVDVTGLSMGIQQLESVYQTVLKVSVKEPLAILFFMSSLQGLHDNMMLVGEQ